MSRTVVLLGTLDTKGEEYTFIRAVLQERGLDTILIDVSCKDADHGYAADYPCNQVAEEGGHRFAQVATGVRRTAQPIMIEGASLILKKLQTEGKLNGIIAIGGSNGTSIASAVMRRLPLGLPKLIVSTMGSGNVGEYMGSKDIAMMYSVTDVVLSRLTRKIFANAAAAIAGMAEGEVSPEEEPKPMLGMTMYGLTQPCVFAARKLLEEHGYEVVIFHGSSGSANMEELTEEGTFDGVLDFTTTAITDKLVGGNATARCERLRAAGERGIPQVVSTGAIDMVNFSAPETVPEQWQHRLFFRYNPQVTLMRANEEENKALGTLFAQRLNRAKGPTTLIVPLRGFSDLDRDGGPMGTTLDGTPVRPWYYPEANRAFVQAVKSNLTRGKLVEVDAHINDPDFAQAAVQVFLRLAV
ncbi:Tm-1-like ATP-binding domain-containing protein [Chloroflexota bacterium]